MRTTESQEKLTAITIATINTLGWSAIAVVRELWGESFVAALQQNPDISVLGQTVQSSNESLQVTKAQIRKLKDTLTVTLTE